MYDLHCTAAPFGTVGNVPDARVCPTIELLVELCGGSNGKTLRSEMVDSIQVVSESADHAQIDLHTLRNAFAIFFGCAGEARL